MPVGAAHTNLFWAPDRTDRGRFEVAPDWRVLLACRQTGWAPSAQHQGTAGLGLGAYNADIVAAP